MPPHLSEEIVFIEAIGIQESGGNYRVVNSSSGALGKYQVLPSNLGPWLRECKLPVVSPQKYLNSPTLQDQLAKCKLGGYYSQYGPRGAAAVWYSGQPDWRATYGNPPVYKYVESVIAIMKKISGGSINIPGPVYHTLPAPKEANWAHIINVSSKGIGKHHVQTHAANHMTWALLSKPHKLHFPPPR